MAYQPAQDSIPLVQQPRVYPNMNAKLPEGNRNVIGKETHADGKRDWSHGLYGCCNDCETCMLATFSPCIIYSQNKSRLEHLERQGLPHPDGGETCTGDCGFYCCLGIIGLSWILQMATRGEIRRRYRITGNGCGDCYTAFCCFCCSLTQESRELELEERTYH